MLNIPWQMYLDLVVADVLRVLPRLFAVVVILLVLRYVLRLATAATHRALERVKLAQSLELALARFVRIIVILVGVVVVLLVMGWGELALSFVAGLGISGLIIGFALQDIAKNFAAGLLLLFMRPFDVGDRIAVAGDEGMVMDVALRATTLRTSDGRELLIPNAMIYTDTIANLTRYPQRRYSVELKLQSTTVPAEAFPLLREAVQSIDEVVAKPGVQVVATSATSESFVVTVNYWVPSRGVDAAAVKSLVVQRLQALAHERQWLP